jgi:hypothetical protein
MGGDMDRQELIQRVHESRQRLDDILSHVEEKRMNNKLPGSPWTIQDLLGHIGFWEQRISSLYSILVAGKVPQDTVDDANIDAVNERSYLANRAKSLQEVQREEADAYLAILAIAENAPEADLFDASKFLWTQGRPFFQYIADNTYGHYDEHIDDLIAAAEQKPATS